MLFTPLNESLICHLLALLDCDICFWSFTPLFIRHGCYTAFEDVRMCYDDGLEGNGGDVLAAY